MDLSSRRASYTLARRACSTRRTRGNPLPSTSRGRALRASVPTQTDSARWHRLFDTYLPMDEPSLAHFVNYGFVILRGLIPEDVVESWRQQSWDVLTADRYDRSTWPTPGDEGARNLNIYTDEARAASEVWPWSGVVARAADGKGEPADEHPVRPTVGEVPQVKAVLDQLLGVDRYDSGMDEDFNHVGRELDVQVWKWPAKVGVRPRSGASAYTSATKEGGEWLNRDEPAGHIEAYRGQRPSKPNPAGWCDRFQLGATTYLESVVPGGGGTLLWPSSHRAIHRYFCEHPDTVVGGGAVGGGNDPNFPTRVGGPERVPLTATNLRQLGGYEGGPPIEATMDAGDVLLWHHFLVHQGSANHSTKIRQALIARWHNTTSQWDGNDIGGIATDGDLWKCWGDAVRQIVAARL
eukprot:COSAG02_NODE_2566_length_8519_cov_3.109857_2_plen_408_part_00